MEKNSQNIMLTCPGCGNSFYAKHGNRQYCTVICYNKFYNNNRRDKSSPYLSTLDKNINILQAVIGSKKEVDIEYSELEKYGFDFRIYSEKVPSNSNKFIFYLAFGPYITNITHNNLFKIKIK
jgi:ribosomal protein S27AE